MPVGPVAKRLKEATADLHREAERHVRILDDDASEATYIRFLDRMFGFHAAVEDRFAQHPGLVDAGFDPARRRKQGWLAEDLHSLGAPVDRPRCTSLPPLAGVADALGAAYVVEGSTLGGPFILTKLRFEPRAVRFLTGYGAETGSMWRAFGALIETQLAQPEALDAAVRGARATFASLIEWLDELAREPPQPFRGVLRKATA